jgi:signal transduction histidine kinase
MLPHHTLCKNVVAFILLLIATQVACSQSYIIQAPDKSIQLAEHLSYQIDSTNEDFQTILRRDFKKEVPSKHYANDKVVFWTKLILTNQTNSDQFVITIDQWNEASLFVENGSDWTEVVSGTNVPVNKRPLSLHRLLSFPVVIQPGQTKTFIFKTRITKPIMRYYANLFSFLSKIELDESAHAYRKYIGNQLLVMLILGVTSILFFYNLVLFFFDRQKTSLILAIYFIIVSLLVANVHGVTTNYLFVSWQAFELPLALILAHITPLIIAAFLAAFFKLHWRQWEFYALAAFSCFILFSLVYSLLTQQSLFFFARRYFEYITFLSVVISAIWQRKQGAIIVIIALLVTIITSFYAEIRSIFFANINFLGPDVPYLMGILTQVVIFSIAATYRVRSLQHGVDQMKEEQRKTIEQQNKLLKDQVEEKTRQLQNALNIVQQKKDELEEVNQELSQQSASVNELNKRLEELVMNRTEALHATMRDLDTFLYRTSHDLRRPLTTILGITNLVSKETSVDTIQSMMTHINKTVQDLDRMLKKLIAISFCYSERTESESIDLKELIEEVSKATLHEYHLPESSFRLSLGSSLPLMNSNSYLLKMVLSSIFENSAQYGGAHVHIHVSIHFEDGNWVLKVHDNGPGIDLAYQKPVFDMFFRAHEKSTGNGLGLYLVKIAIQKLGGSVKLHSSQGNGTEIVLSIPNLS